MTLARLMMFLPTGALFKIIDPGLAAWWLAMWAATAGITEAGMGTIFGIFTLRFAFRQISFA